MVVLLQPTSRAVATPGSAIARDLALELTLRRTGSAPLGLLPPVSVAIVNRSRLATYPVVLPGDGSASGLRPPRTWLTAEGHTDAGWRPLGEPRQGHCGLYAVDWARDVVRLAPGARRLLSAAYPLLPWDLRGVDRVRVVAHYAYALTTRGSAPPPSMADVPEYELTSNAVEVVVAGS